jgi:hypothetical protein
MEPSVHRHRHNFANLPHFPRLYIFLQTTSYRLHVSYKSIFPTRFSSKYSGHIFCTPMYFTWTTDFVHLNTHSQQFICKNSSPAEQYQCHDLTQAPHVATRLLSSLNSTPSDPALTEIIYSQLCDQWEYDWDIMCALKMYLQLIQSYCNYNYPY